MADKKETTTAPDCAALTCPITHELMVEPVSDPEGNTYERAAIEEWISKNGTSPLTRNPLRVEDLCPNRAVVHLLEEFHKANDGAAASGSVISKGLKKLSNLFGGGDSSAAAGTSATTPVEPLELSLSSNAEGVLVSVSSAQAGERAPSDIVCVIDVSGSMGTDAPAPATADGKAGENAGFSVLDIVKHACQTIIASMSPNDRLGIVAYSTEARVTLPLTVMTKAGQALARKAVDDLKPEATTNLFGGLHAALELLRATTPADTHRFMSTLLFTDGVPNVHPPRGTIPTLQRYKDAGKMRGTISTFGFGYSLDSELLVEIAQLGGGSYAFIPDAGLVGTIFVNAIANLLATAARDAVVQLAPLGETEFIGDDGAPISGGSLSVALGAVQHGQSRDVFVRARTPGGKAHCAEARLVCARLSGAEEASPLVEIDETTQAADEAAAGLHRARARLVAALGAATPVTADSMAEAQAAIAAAVADADSFGPRATDLVADLKGQATIAVSKREFFDKWGKHYLPSLAMAHAAQQCNNFKDPGVQRYGGALFTQIADDAEDIFNKLKPPTPSNTGRQFRGGGGGARARGARGAWAAAPRSMASYNTAYSGCVDGASLVTMADGSERRADAVRPGDAVAAAGVAGGAAVVRCVVRTLCDGGVNNLVELRREGRAPIRITAWHPVRADGAWTFPIDLARRAGGGERSVPCDAVYSYVLEEAAGGGAAAARGAMIVGGFEYATLGHGVRGDAVLSHSYFGTDAVLRDLSRMVGWADGYITRMDRAARSASTGRVVGWLQREPVVAAVERTGEGAEAAHRAAVAATA